ncbi:MAG: hypothetical protein JJE39_07480 [Vicinamibacteria bacterium]|nr:hypothetical protein [Vicinamibacteria bacterium]
MTRKKTTRAAARQAGSQETAEPTDVRGFEVQLSCPHCGGPFVVSDATVSHTCEHCRSLLFVEAPDREEVFVEPAQMTDPAVILAALLQYRIDAHRAALVAKHSDSEGRQPPDFLVDGLLSRFERRLRETAQMIDCRPVYVPYHQTSGKVVQAVLGRHGDRPKIALLRAYTAEQTAAGYDTSRFNLRDTGLRLGRSIFRPLLSADVEKLGRFLPRAQADTSRRELEKWRNRDLEPGFESVTKQGQVVVTFEATVYRPYFLVRALLDRGDETLLFDGGFGTIAGYLSEDERTEFTKGKDADPLGTKGASFRHLAIVPARCPSCGADPKLEDDANLSVCENCHAGVSPTAKGIVLGSYDREEGIIPARDMAFLPFWRFPFQIEGAGSPASRTLEAYAAALFPQGLPTGFAPRGPFVYVPAWRLLSTPAGDNTFTDLAQTVHSIAWNWTPDRVGLEARPRFVPVSLPEEEAKSLAWAALFAMHTKASATRLNTMLLKRMLFDAKLSFGAGSVALIAFKQDEKLYVRPEVSLPRLVVDGGPLLAAQRMSVQAAANACAAFQSHTSMSDRVRTSRLMRATDS